jgi:hypothetical protein
MGKYKDFCIFILTHGRADNCITFKTLQKMGNTYPVYFIVDNEDKTIKQYQKNFGKENVIIFDKQKYFENADTFDNFNIKTAILYARNATYDIAKELGYNYFLQLDDDYKEFEYRINGAMNYPSNYKYVKNLDIILTAFLRYFKSISAKSIAMSQGGDWFGGKDAFGNAPKRKVMNSFFCKTNNPIVFKGVFNDDVNTYTTTQITNEFFLTIPHIRIGQIGSQQLTGGMSNVYHNMGTYVKSFYSVMNAPNCTKINTMGVKHRRLHHNINWNNAVPCIINEIYKK